MNGPDPQRDIVLTLNHGELVDVFTHPDLNVRVVVVDYSDEGIIATERKPDPLQPGMASPETLDAYQEHVTDTPDTFVCARCGERCSTDILAKTEDDGSRVCSECVDRPAWSQP